MIIRPIVITMSRLVYPARATLLKELTKHKSIIQQTSSTAARTISTTNALFAEPPKKKRRLDPTIMKVRVERKIKKHEREIAKIESEPRQAIPIAEYQPNSSEIRDLKARPSRKLEDVGLDEAAVRAAQRLWNFYRREQTRMEQSSIRRVEQAQTRALESLKKLDETLYKGTIAVDEITLIPFKSSHLRKETAPNPNYTRPDGYIKDVSKEWIM